MYSLKPIYLVLQRPPTAGPGPASCQQQSAAVGRAPTSTRAGLWKHPDSGSYSQGARVPFHLGSIDADMDIDVHVDIDIDIDIDVDIDVDLDVDM